MYLGRMFGTLVNTETFVKLVFLKTLGVMMIFVIPVKARSSSCSLKME